jgi:hypothetical protein
MCSCGVGLVGDDGAAFGEGEGVAAEASGEVNDGSALGELAGVVAGDGEAGGLFEGFSFEEHFVGEVAKFFGRSFAEIELHERPARGFVAVFGGELLGREGRGVGEGFEVEQVQIVYSVFSNLPGLER